MPQQKNISKDTILRIAEAGCFILGPAITAYFVANFTVDSYGYYYRDIEGGIAFGVFIIAIGYALRNWRRDK